MNEEVANLVESGKLQRLQGEKLSALEPGVYCFHKSWGAGKIDSWDLLGDQIFIDFEGRPGHAMKLAFAVKSLEPIPDDHIVAKRLDDLEGLRKQAEEEPVTLMERLISSYDGSVMLDQVEAVLKGTVISDAKYRAWWDATKKKMRQDRRFVVPSKRNLPLELRDEDVDLKQGLLADFNEARELKAKVQSVEAILKDIEQFDDPVAQLQPVVDACNELAAKSQRLQTPATLELIMARERLQEAVEGLKNAENAPSVAKVLRENESSLSEIITQLPAAGQRRAYDAFPEAFDDRWAEALLGLINSVGIRGLGEIARISRENGAGEQFYEYLNLGIQQRSLASEVLTWICKERNRVARDVFKPELAAAVINALERDHYDEEAKKSNKLQDILLADSSLIRDLLEEASRNQIRMFVRRLKGTPAIDELNRNSLLARIIKVHPEIQELVTGKEDLETEDEGLIVSWESLAKRQSQFEELVKKKIPQNTEEIALARSYGDLRENAEFKAAKEMQAVLMRQKEELEQEINLARGTDFSDVDATAVNVGTVVTWRDVASGQGETYTILGAWDTDVEKGIISYLSQAGQNLMGHKVGEQVTLPSEDSGSTREVKIESIEPYVK